jgi:tripartite-type tricarboxylate transporter receptor subunit TctC
MPARSSTRLRTTLRRAALLAGAAWLALASPSARAEEFPSKLIRLVLVYPPGGSTDITARILAPKAGALLRQTIVVDNKPGANGTIGMDAVAKSAPDGYTLVLTSSSPLVIAPHTFSKIGYNTVRDFVGVTAVAANPEVLAVSPSRPFNDLKGMIEEARKRDVFISSSGAGGLGHLAIEALKKATGARLVHVPYKGGAPAITDAIAGHVDGVIVDLAPAFPFIKSGKLNSAAITSDQRSEFLPDALNSAEQGFPNFIALNWIGVLAPASTPKPVVDKLHDAFVKAAEDPEAKSELAKIALSPFTMPTAEGFHQFLTQEYEKWGRIARETGARAEEE